MKGRKPIPTKLKVLAGNPGKRRLNDQEPQATGKPSCPKELNALARKEWHRIVKELSDKGIIGTVDRACLALYCAAWARWCKAYAIVEQSGEVLKSEDGGMYQNPYLAIANRAHDQVVQLAGEYGMTASTRSRIKVVKSEAPSGKARFFAS